MNAMLNFFQDVFTGGSANQRPVGLTSFKTVTQKKTIEKKHAQKGDIKLSDLMRRVH